MASRREAAPAQRAARDSHATLGAGLTRLISASLLSCRALSKPNAFPPGGDKEAALEAGSSPGHAPPSPPASCARWTPRSARRAQVAARGRRRLPWNLLLSAPDMASAGLPPAPGFADAARDEEEAQAPGLSSGWLRVAAGPRGGGTPRAADTPLPLRPAPPSLPPLPSPPLPPPAPRASKRLLCGTRSPPADPSAGGRGKCTARSGRTPPLSPPRTSASPCHRNEMRGSQHELQWGGCEHELHGVVVRTKCSNLGVGAQT